MNAFTVKGVSILAVLTRTTVSSMKKDGNSKQK